MSNLFERFFGRKAATLETLADRRWALATALRAKRVQLRRGPFNEPVEASQKLNKKRFARHVTQRLKRKYKKGSRLPPLAKELLAARYRPNAILESLFPKRSQVWRTLPRRNSPANQLSLDVHTFSFVDDPVGTMKVLAQLVELEATAVSARVNFKFSHCNDIGPFLVLAEMMAGFAPILSGGQISTPVQKVIEAVGLRRALRMEFLGPNDNRDVWAMPVQRRRAADTSMSDTRHLDPQRREVVCDMFCDNIDNWLASADTNCELTDEARGRFKTIIGEILDNAERHSSLTGDGSWTIAAFMARRVVDGQERYACHMAFVSLGTTFAEGLKSAAPGLRSSLAGYVEQQVGLGASQSAETLLTLAALQDGVTRDQQALEEGRGGTGLLDIAELVHLLAATEKEIENSRIAIISGRSCILLQKPYLKGVSAAPQEPRRLWCNATNSRKEAPDGAHVFDLPVRLPGTVISVAFNIDPEYLRTVVEENDRDPS